MATYSFDGSANLTTEFNATVDRVIIDLQTDELVSVTQNEDENTVTFVAASGAVLTLTSTSLTALSADGVILSDIDFSFGTDAANTLTGEVVVGLDGTDGITATSDDALLYGNEGADTLGNGGFSSVRMFGGMGNDTLNLVTAASSDASVLVGGLGQDTVNVGGTFAAGTFTGTTAYTSDITVIGGNGSNDTADGADRINVNLSSDGSAVIYGNGGGDTISVTGGGDVTVYGGAGDDSITSAAGDGVYVGGLGRDTFTITTAGDEASVTVYGGNELSDTIDGADVINVTLTGDDTASIYGNGGSDDINLLGTGGGEYNVFGGQGDDTIAGSGAAAGTVGDGSAIYGGLGADTINLAVTGDNATVTVFGGNGSTDAVDGRDTISVDLAATTGTSTQEATIYGNSGNDVINITGGGEATVFGGVGNDTINVGVSGNTGDGVYVLTGGQGSDVFSFENAAVQTISSTTTAATLNSITDLNLNEDKIDFGGAVAATFDVSATATTGANLSAAAVSAFNSATATTAAGTDSVVLFTYAGNQFLVHADANAATGIAATDIDNLIQVTGVTGTLDTTDFVA